MAEVFQISAAALGLSQIILQIGKEIYLFTKEAPHVYSKLEVLVRKTATYRRTILCVRDVLEACSTHHKKSFHPHAKSLLSTLAEQTADCAETCNLIQNEISTIKRKAAGLKGRRRLEFFETCLLHWEHENNTSLPSFERSIEEQQQAVQTLLTCLSIYANLGGTYTGPAAELEDFEIEPAPILPRYSTQGPIKPSQEGSRPIFREVHYDNKINVDAVGACKKGNLESLRVILGSDNESGKSIDLKEGKSYLHYVAQYLKGTVAQEFVRCLVDTYNADVNQQSVRTGETPLHVAVKLRKVELVEILILRKANVHMKQKGGKDALSLANRVDTQIMELLIKNGATHEGVISCRTRDKKVLELMGQTGIAKLPSSVSEQVTKGRFSFDSFLRSTSV